MNDRKLTTEDLIAGMQDIRLPSETAGGQVADILATVSIGILLALLLSRLLQVFTKRTQKTHHPSLFEQLEVTKSLPDGERRMELLRLLKKHHPEAASHLGIEIYKSGGIPDIEELEQQLTQVYR